MSPRRPRSGKPRASKPAPRSAKSTATEGYDWLRVRDIQAYGHLGVTQKERDLGQRLEADVEIAYARGARRRPDSLDSFVDYEEVSRMVRGTIGMARCRLLETLAEEVALSLLAEFDPPRVRVRLRKMHIPVADFSGCPEVEIERAR